MPDSRDERRMAIALGQFNRLLLRLECAAGVAVLIFDDEIRDGVVTRRGDPQSLVEAAPLRSSGDCMSKPITNSAAMLARTKSARLAPKQRLTGALAAPPRRSASNASGRGRPASGGLRRRSVHCLAAGMRNGPRLAAWPAS
jgi:hypothetical protein